MMQLLAKNWSKALGEVCASIVGSLGFILIIASILAAQDRSLTSGTAFGGYFAGGQIGLSILSVSGVTFIALLRHRATHQFLALVLLILLVFPIAATAFIIGLNPGFQAGGLTHSLLRLLWVLFFGMHVLWFFILLLEPTIPTAQQAGEATETRVNKIKLGAAGRER